MVDSGGKEIIEIRPKGLVGSRPRPPASPPSFPDSSGIIDMTEQDILGTKAAKGTDPSQPIIVIHPHEITTNSPKADVTIIAAPDGRLLSDIEWEQKQAADRAARAATPPKQKLSPSELPTNEAQLAVDSLVQASDALRGRGGALSLMVASDILQQTLPDGTKVHVLDLGLLPPSASGSLSEGSRLYASITSEEANVLARDLLRNFIPRRIAKELLQNAVPSQAPKSASGENRGHMRRRIPNNAQEEQILSQIDQADSHALNSNGMLVLAGHEQVVVGPNVRGEQAANTTLFFTHKGDPKKRRPGLQVTISPSAADLLVFKIRNAGLFDDTTRNSVKSIASEPL